MWRHRMRESVFQRIFISSMMVMIRPKIQDAEKDIEKKASSHWKMKAFILQFSSDDLKNKKSVKLFLVSIEKFLSLS